MRPQPALSIFATALASATAVAAEPSSSEGTTTPRVFDESSAQYRPPKTERRGGFAMALTIGYGLGEYHGYPLEVRALNDPSQKQSTGTSLASNFSLWLGGSPRDWITAGVGFTAMSTKLNETTGVAVGILFHVEGFPLYSLGGTYRHLGIGLDGGMGISSLFDKSDKDMENPLAESGGLSTLGFNVFWEPIVFWHLSMGPSLNYTHAFSQTMQLNQVTLGFRTALYGVQPKKAKKP